MEILDICGNMPRTMTSPCTILAQLDAAISEILATGVLERARQGAQDWGRYSLTQLQEMRKYYASECASQNSDANNGGLLMSLITNKEPQ